MPRILQGLGEGQHLGDVLGRPGEHVRGQDVHERLVGVEGRLVRVGDLGGRPVFEPGGHEHPVLATIEPLVSQVPDVGDVLDVEHLEPVIQQGPPEDVGEQVRAQVADVGVPVHGRAARVHPDAPGLQWHDRLHGPGEGVAEAQGHPDIVAPTPAPTRRPSNPRISPDRP